MPNADVNQLAELRDSFSVHDVEFGFAERRRDFVLDNFDFGAIAHDVLAVFDLRDAPDVQAQRRIKLQRASASGGFWRVVNDDTINHVCVIPLNLKVKAAHRASRGFVIDLGDTRWHYTESATRLKACPI